MWERQEPERNQVSLSLGRGIVELEIGETKARRAKQETQVHVVEVVHGGEEGSFARVLEGNARV